MTLWSCLIWLPSANTCVTYQVDARVPMLSASRANTRDACSCYRIGRRCRETSSWHVRRYKYSEPPFPRAAPFDEGKCIVSASWLFPRSLSIPLYLLCHGNIFILRDNTIKAGRVLADFWSISTFVCAKMPRTKKKNGRGKWASCRIIWPCLFGSSVLLGFVVLCVVVAHCASRLCWQSGTTNAKGLVSKQKANSPRQHEAQTGKCDRNSCSFTILII